MRVKPIRKGDVWVVSRLTTYIIDTTSADKYIIDGGTSADEYIIDTQPGLEPGCATNCATREHDIHFLLLSMGFKEVKDDDGNLKYVSTNKTLNLIFYGGCTYIHIQSRKSGKEFYSV